MKIVRLLKRWNIICVALGGPSALVVYLPVRTPLAATLARIVLPKVAVFRHALRSL